MNPQQFASLILASCASQSVGQVAEDLFPVSLQFELNSPAAPSTVNFECAASHPGYPGLIFGVRSLPTPALSEVYVWRWQGGTEFSDAAVFDAGSVSRSIAVADFVGDPTDDFFPDIVATNSAGDDITFLFNDVVNGTTSPSPWPTGSGTAPRTVRAADIDNDGDLDVIWVNQGDNSVNGIDTLLNDGSGAFTPVVNAEPAGNNPYGLVVEDFDGDGNLDAAMTNYLSGDVSVLLGNGDGTFQPETRYNIGPAPIPPPGASSSPLEVASGIVAADFDNDGALDLAATCWISGTNSVLLGNGDGTFQPQLLSTGLNAAAWVAAGDLDLDGNTDMVIALSTPGEVSVCFGLGNGTFQPPQFLSAFSGTPTYAGVAPWYVEVSDVNSDGALDIIVTDTGAFGVSSKVYVLLNSGPACNAADIAVPFGVLDLSDQTKFVNEYAAGCP